MKNTDISEIRQFIRDWQKDARAHLPKNRREEIFCEIILTKCDSLLTLLPCETCNDVGFIDRPDSFDNPIPCPGCQS